MKNNFWFLLINVCRPAGVLFFLLVAPLLMKGQLNIGINGGISRNSLISNRGYRPFTTGEKIGGYTAGMILQYPVNKFITIGAEPSFVGKNYRIARSDYYQGVYETTYNNYIQLPILLTFSLSNERMLGGISAGGYSAYWAHSRKKGEIPNLSNLSLQDGDYTNVFQNMQRFSYDATYHFNSKLDNRWEFGWVAGLDFQYTLVKRIACFINARYYYSLTDQGKDYSVNQQQRFNETMVVTAGLLFKTNRSKKNK
ncbi:PorT family protein [Pedobacter sp. PAMC26386]|nr:PorT family protein [Pedobacter sp. PAMC26386]